ncbi:MAG: hypothetical protein HY722_11715 [Planctomycetes bacterium]|nr:hypothetical protein [Planctomycetota bacterium]
MHRLPVEELKEGMILAEPILDPVGRVLLGKGEELSALYIGKLSKWGILEVQVESPLTTLGELKGAGQRPEPALSEEEERRIHAEVAHRFEQVARDEHMELVRAVALKHLLRGGTPR